MNNPLLTVRPIQRSDLPLLDGWLNDVATHSSYNTFGFSPTQGHEQGFNQHGFLNEDHGELLIVIEDRVIGNVSYRKTYYGPPKGGTQAYAIGIFLIPAARKQGYGVEAQRQIAAYLFATYPITRVEASTDARNLAEQRALEKAGFTREGVLRQAQWREGAWHDLVSYSKLRGE